MKIAITMLLFSFILISCTIGTTNKITTNQYPCDTDSLGNKTQIVNINIPKPDKK